jgi:hypothetical protein
MDKLSAMAIELFERVDQSKIMAKTMTLEIKTATFEVIQRSMTSNHFMHKKDDIVCEALKLLHQVWPLKEPTRLIGLRFTNIRS